MRPRISRQSWSPADPHLVKRALLHAVPLDAPDEGEPAEPEPAEMELVPRIHEVAQHGVMLAEAREPGAAPARERDGVRGERVRGEEPDDAEAGIALAGGGAEQGDGGADLDDGVAGGRAGDAQREDDRGVEAGGGEDLP